MKEEERVQELHNRPHTEIKKPSVVHAFEEKKSMNKKIFIVLFGAILLGGLSGVIGASIGGKTASSDSVGGEVTVEEAAEKGAIIGSQEEGKFTDEAEGLLKEGGVDGEGAFHLERPGGDSQNVYLTSSVIDLSVYVGKKVKVWGETNAAKKAGWLMDVGRLQILD